MAKKVTFKKVSNCKVKKLFLKGHSKVLSAVVFESGEGIVELGSNSSVSGKVKGGQIIKTEHE